jgi:hypothetical protein
MNSISPTATPPAGALAAAGEHSPKQPAVACAPAAAGSFNAADQLMELGHIRENVRILREEMAARLAAIYDAQWQQGWQHRAQIGAAAMRVREETSELHTCVRTWEMRLVMGWGDGR